MHVAHLKYIYRVHLPVNHKYRIISQNCNWVESRVGSKRHNCTSA